MSESPRPLAQPISNVSISTSQTATFHPYNNVGSHNKMKRDLSIYVDLLRALAAFAVVGEHCSDFVGGWIWHFGGFGSEAVGVFFVLSGLVIAHVTADRESTAMSYATARAVRLYSVVIPALLVTLLVDAIGKHYDATTYVAERYVEGTAIDYLRFFTFTHQFWNYQTHIGTMGPYWSLGFEVTYYVAFGIFVFLERSRPIKYLATFLVLALMGPRIAAYFPLWLMGVGCHKMITRFGGNTSPNKSQNLVWVLTLVATPIVFILWRDACYAGIDHRLKISAAAEFSSAFFRPIIYFYGVGLLVSLHLIAYSRLPLQLSNIVSRFGKLIRWVAGATFTLYLLNLPILLCLKALLSAVPASAIKTSIVLAATVAICFLLAEAFERRKLFWRETMQALTRKLSAT